MGLGQAHELYAQPSVREIAQVISTSETLARLLAQPNPNNALHKNLTDLNLYLSLE